MQLRHGKIQIEILQKDVQSCWQKVDCLLLGACLFGLADKQGCSYSG